MRVTNLDGVQGVSVSGDQITIQAGASGWQTGQFVVSAEGAEGKGQLRRVESITFVNGATVLQTRIASVNEVVSDVKLSSSFNSPVLRGKSPPHHNRPVWPALRWCTRD